MSADIQPALFKLLGELLKEHQRDGHQQSVCRLCQMADSLRAEVANSRSKPGRQERDRGELLEVPAPGEGKATALEVVGVRNITEKAFCVQLKEADDRNGKPIAWVPKSCVHPDNKLPISEGSSGVLLVKSWFAKKERLA